MYYLYMTSRVQTITPGRGVDHPRVILEKAAARKRVREIAGTRVVLSAKEGTRQKKLRLFTDADAAAITKLARKENINPVITEGDTASLGGRRTKRRRKSKRKRRKTRRKSRRKRRRKRSRRTRK